MDPWAQIGIRVLNHAPRTVRDWITQGITMGRCSKVFKEDRKHAYAMIRRFVELYGIDVEEAEKGLREYQTLDDFFQRKLKPGSRQISGSDVVSMADCRCSVFENVDDAKRYFVKGSEFTLEALFGTKDVSRAEYVVIFRLAPQDYHRFHAPVAGEITRHQEIKGGLSSINPIVVRNRHVNVYTRNKREVLQLGGMLIAFIGATCTGAIHVKREGHVEKGEDIGSFGFGGSTIIMLMPRAYEPEFDLLRNSASGYETIVRMGEPLARRRTPQ